MGWKRSGANRVDANQKTIVTALRKVGCRVYEIERPVDLLVEFRGSWCVLEVKNRDGRNRTTPGQDEFFEITRAPAGIVYDAEDAIAFVSRLTV